MYCISQIQRIVRSTMPNALKLLLCNFGCIINLSQMSSPSYRSGSYCPKKISCLVWVHTWDCTRPAALPRYEWVLPTCSVEIHLLMECFVESVTNALTDQAAPGFSIRMSFDRCRMSIITCCLGLLCPLVSCEDHCKRYYCYYYCKSFYYASQFRCSQNYVLSSIHIYRDKW